MVRKEQIKINGIKHGYIMCEKDEKAPVVLYLHGGPGSPEYPIFQSQLGSSYLCNFNVCYYDHRGCGLSYDKNSKLSLELLVEDVFDITKYLIEKYNKTNIILVAHSFGTYLGINAVQSHPEYYSAYVGISQITNAMESEKRIYDKMLQISNESGDETSKKILEKNYINSEMLSRHYMQNVKGAFLRKYQLNLTRNSLPKYFMIQRLLSAKIYSAKNKIEYYRGLMLCSKALFPMVKDIDLLQNSCSFEIPIYLIHGKYDYQISESLVVEYFKRLSAPKKELIIFEQSAHFPNYEEYDRFELFMKSLL